MPGALRGTLALADQKYQGAVGVNVQSPGAKWFFLTVLQASSQEPGADTFARLARDLKALPEVQTVVLLFNLRSSTLSTDKVQLRLRLAFANPDLGKKAAEEVRQLVKLLQQPLREWIQEIARDPRSFQSVGGVVAPEAVKWIFQVYDQFFVALQDIEIKLEGNVLDIRLPDLAIDLAGMGTLVGEQGRLMERYQSQLHWPQLLQLRLALEDYAAEHRRLPPAAITSKDGKPLLSWRVALLPYLGQKDLYEQFHLEEPWDSPRNKQLLDRMPKVFGPPGKEGGPTTVYRAVVGPGTAFAEGQGFPSNKDGPANTIVIAEAGDAVPWTKPEELSCGPNQPPPPMGSAALFTDGTVRQIKVSLDDKVRRALLMRGGDKVDWARVPVIAGDLVATDLNVASWGVVCKPREGPERYRWGLRVAENACQLQPKDGLLLNTLGVAQFRLGRYREALETLLQSTQLNAEKPQGAIPADLAFLAMTQHKLGQHEQARANLRRLRDKMKEPAHAKDQESQAFLREAEALIEGKE
jgi:hypothetical protein